MNKITNTLGKNLFSIYKKYKFIQLERGMFSTQKYKGSFEKG